MDQAWHAHEFALPDLESKRCFHKTCVAQVTAQSRSRGSCGRILKDAADRERISGVKKMIALAPNQLQGGEAFALHQILEGLEVIVKIGQRVPVSHGQDIVPGTGEGVNRRQARVEIVFIPTKAIEHFLQRRVRNLFLTRRDGLQGGNHLRVTLLRRDVDLADGGVQHVGTLTILAAEHHAGRYRCVAAKRNLHFRAVITNGPTRTGCGCNEGGLGCSDVRGDSLHRGRIGQFITDPDAGRVATLVANRERGKLKEFSAEFASHWRMLPHAPRYKNAYSSRFNNPGDNNEKNPVDHDVHPRTIDGEVQGRPGEVCFGEVSHAKVLSAMYRLALALVILLVCTSALAGPPLSIDDPGILDPLQLEIIAAVTSTNTDSGDLLQLPLLDLSLGVIEDYLQVGVAFSHVHARPNEGKSELDSGSTSLALKWRFVNSEKLQMSFAPYYVFGVSRSAESRGIGDNADVAVFPVNAEHGINEKWRLNGEMSYARVQGGEAYWHLGAAVAYAANSRWDLLLEVAGTSDTAFGMDYVDIRAGFDAALSESFHLLFSMASGLRQAPGEDELDLNVFLGVQYLR